MNVYMFGDSIPPGTPDDIYLSWVIEDVPGGMLSGPYKNREEATAEAQELLEVYDLTTEIKIVRRKDIR